MDFAIKCYFDAEAGRRIRAIWDDLATEGCATFMKKSGTFPGITVGVWENCGEAEMKSLAERFARVAHPLRVSTFGVGAFLTDPSHVFLGVVPSDELLEFHHQFHTVDPELSRKCAHYYQPGNWVPHSTLALRCEKLDIPRIVEIALRHDTRIDATIEAIGVNDTVSTEHLSVYRFV